MLDTRDQQRRRQRMRRREQRRRMRRRRNLFLGVMTSVLLLVALRFVVKKLNDNSSAMSARYIDSTTPYASSEGVVSVEGASASSDSVADTTEAGSAAPEAIEISYVDSEEVPAPVPEVRTAKEQAKGFQDSLDCFLVTKEEAVLYSRNSAKSMEVAVLPKGTYVETYGEEDGWTKVSSNGTDGFVRNRQLDLIADGHLFKVAGGKVIVNRTYGLDESYKTVFNEEAAAALRVMLEAMERDGRKVEVGAQVRDAREEAKELVLMGNPANAPEPGHSVFQTGYGVQFYAPGTDPRMDNHFEQTEAFQWLKEHAAEYGFILRYPEGSESVTGYRADPTIFYYVGVEDAKAIAQSNQTMETYYGVR